MPHLLPEQPYSRSDNFIIPLPSCRRLHLE